MLHISAAALLLFGTDLKKSSISTRDCSENIFYKLTFIFGGIIVILIIIPLTMLIFKIQNTNTQEKGNSTSIHSEDLLALPQMLITMKHNITRYKQALSQEAGVVNDIISYTDPDRKKLFSVE
ncbi:hypothetical protein cypCar_00017193 [Cyprinus carpio]|nr:hypothetical protein cypCar_00017193 [Cyprinus carpio]